MSLRPRRSRPQGRTRVHRPRVRTRSLRTRLLVLVSATLVLVCATMALTTAFVQRAYLMGDLDGRVAAAASRSLGGASLHPEIDDDLGFLDDNGHATGLLAARLDEDGAIVAAEVSLGGSPKGLTAAQTAAQADIATDGSQHTRTVPGLGAYRLTAVESGRVRVLAGLPMDDVQRMIGGLVVAEAVVAVAGLFVAGCICTVVIRRQLRPLGRVAATAAEVSRAPLDRGEVTGLTRVPAGDTDPASEAGQVGAALNRMIDHVESSLTARRHTEARMRRFLADAGHELRTPLASSTWRSTANRCLARLESSRSVIMQVS